MSLNAYSLFYSQIQDFDLMVQLFLSDFFGFLNLNEEKKTWDFFDYYHYYYYYFSVKLVFPENFIMLAKVYI